MRPGSKYAFFVYSSDDRVKLVLRVHQRVPITIRGCVLRIERALSRPYWSPGASGYHLELGRPLEPAKSSAIIEELKRTVPKWRGSNEPSRVIWIGRLPMDVSRESLANFWSRLGCVVEVRTSLNGFAHVEFASTEEALRAARQGTPHGFRYENRLLHVDFAVWKLYIGPEYRVVYISGWPASHNRSALLQWAYDIPNVLGATVLPPFRGEQRSDPRGAYLHFQSIDDARAGLRKLDRRAGPRGETLHVSLSRLPSVHPDQLWQWAYATEEMGGPGSELKDEEAYFVKEWDGLGFGTGTEEQEEQGVGVLGCSHKPPPPHVNQVGTRGGRGVWKDWVWSRANERLRTRAGTGTTGEHDDTSSHPLLRMHMNEGEQVDATPPSIPAEREHEGAEEKLEDPEPVSSSPSSSTLGTTAQRAGL
ncbi:hypothetical protein F5148DRAFT_1206079, partial [Russula earlei]